jgi:hypothetical protein
MMVIDAMPQMAEGNSSDNGFGFGVGNHRGGSSSSHAMAVQVRERNIPLNVQRQQLQSLPPQQQLQQRAVSRVRSGQRLPIAR